jgi:hypothetical protein
MIDELPALTTTGIGSLPHRSVTEAMHQAFRVDVPYLPELPMRDPREFMLAHATEGIPGIVSDREGMVALDLDEWKKGRGAFDDKLHAAIEGNQLELFLPSHTHQAALDPFMNAVARENKRVAKVQLAGPLTVQWSLTTTSGEVPPAAALTHVSRTILARSLARAKAVGSAGAKPIVFFDEPGLYAFSRTQPRHLLMMQELRINVMALKKHGAAVGLHCCSEADWVTLMGLGLDVLAIDAKLSLRSLLKAGETLVTFVSMGGRLALGVIPTNQGEQATVPDLLNGMSDQLAVLEQYFPTRASIFEHILSRSLLTPACGLAFKTEGEAEHIIDQLDAFRSAYRTSRSSSGVPQLAHA